MTEAFDFRSESFLIKFTGTKAEDLRSLCEGIGRVSGSSIFHHVFYSLLNEHFTVSENLNDFARWVINVLGDDALGEKLACIDPLAFDSVREVREKLIGYIKSYIGEASHLSRVPRGREFHFTEARSIVYSSGISARNLEELHDAFGRISIQSLFYHFVESRLRLGHQRNDISVWIENSLGNKELAERIGKLNPYFLNLWEMKETIKELIGEYL